MADDYGIDDVALEQRIAELSDDQFAELVTRTRPPQVPKHPVVPGVGHSPQDRRAAERAAITAAEQAGDWATSFHRKSEQLRRLMNKEK